MMVVSEQADNEFEYSRLSEVYALSRYGSDRPLIGKIIGTEDGLWRIGEFVTSNSNGINTTSTGP
jgi:hypothetical protein